MSHTTWHTVCHLTAIVPGTGVCALREGRKNMPVSLDVEVQS